MGGTGKNKTVMFTDFIMEYWKGDHLSKHTKTSNVGKCYEEKESRVIGKGRRAPLESVIRKGI